MCNQVWPDNGRAAGLETSGACRRTRRTLSDRLNYEGFVMPMDYAIPDGAICGTQDPRAFNVQCHE